MDRVLPNIESTLSNSGMSTKGLVNVISPLALHRLVDRVLPNIESTLSNSGMSTKD